MKDKQFLYWLHQRLIKVHDENPNIDYMLKFASIINHMDSNIDTPNRDPCINHISGFQREGGIDASTK